MSQFYLWARHSRAGGNPVESITPREAREQPGFARFVEYLNSLDSRLRGNDAVLLDNFV